MFDKYTYIWQCLFNGFDVFSFDRLSFGFALCAGSIPINGPGLIKRASDNIYATNEKTTQTAPVAVGGGLQPETALYFYGGPEIFTCRPGVALSPSEHYI